MLQTKQSIDDTIKTLTKTGNDAVKLWGNKDSMLGLATATLFNCINTTCISTCGWNVRENGSFQPFVYKTIFLPRLARDKHRESTQKRLPVRAVSSYQVTCVDECKILKPDGYSVCQQGAAPVIGPTGNGYNGCGGQTTNKQTRPPFFGVPVSRVVCLFEWKGNTIVLPRQALRL
jgi:hypothetical protein